MKKYKSYSNAFFFILIPGLLLSLWMIFGTLSGIIREDKTDNLVVVIGILMTIGDLFLLSEVIRKIKIFDDYISRRNFLFKEKKMFFSEIKKYEVSLGSDGNHIILYSNDSKMMIPFSGMKFVCDFSEILKKQFYSETQEKVEDMKRNGFEIHCAKYKIRCDMNGITNLKTNKQFQWEDIKCRKRECIDGSSYIFSIDKEIKLGVNKINFYFAMEDFFDEMSKKCIIT